MSKAHKRALKALKKSLETLLLHEGERTTIAARDALSDPCENTLVRHAYLEGKMHALKAALCHLELARYEQYLIPVVTGEYLHSDWKRGK